MLSDMGLLISSLHLLDCKCGDDIFLYLQKTYKCVIYIFYIQRERQHVRVIFPVAKGAGVGHRNKGYKCFVAVVVLIGDGNCSTYFDTVNNGRSIGIIMELQ